MDSAYAVASASWLMGELIRVFHSVSTEDAKRAVDNLTQLKTPAVWVDENVRRVLDPKTKLADQVLLLVASNGAGTTSSQVADWTETTNRTYLKKVIAALHNTRFIEAAQPDKSIKLLPAGAAAVRELLART